MVRGRTMAPSSDCKDVQTILFTHMKVWKSYMFWCLFFQLIPARVSQNGGYHPGQHHSQ